MNIYLRPDGRVECLYSDFVQELDLGTLRVKRASNVEFDNEQQTWTVNVNGEIVARAWSREDALALEVAEMTTRFEHET